VSRSVTFIKGLIDSFDLGCARHGTTGRITSYRKINIHGSKTPVVLLEYDYEDGSGACYPWRNQFLFRPDGRLMAILDAERFWMERLFPHQKPYLMALYSTYHGNEGHKILKIVGDTIINIYPGWEGENFVRTGGVTSDHRFLPDELHHRVRDLNRDGYNDIEFYGRYQFNPYGGEMDDSGDAYSIPVRYTFLYRPNIGRFVPRRDFENWLDSTTNRIVERNIKRAQDHQTTR
jgi:hypothetical protein